MCTILMDAERKPKAKTERPAAIRITGGAHDNTFVEPVIHADTAFELDNAGPGNRVIGAKHYPPYPTSPSAHAESRRPKGKAMALIPALPWKRNSE